MLIVTTPPAFGSRSVTVTVYRPDTSGVKYGACVVASVSVADDPAGTASAQSYVSCVLPYSSTGMPIGTLCTPVVQFHGSVAWISTSSV